MLDLIMPGMDGRDTFRALRKINPEITAVLVSGYSVDGEAHEVVDEGMKGFLPKPFRLEDLVTMLAKVR